MNEACGERATAPRIFSSPMFSSEAGCGSPAGRRSRDSGAVTMGPPLAISYDDVLAARERIHDFIHRTPVVTSRLLDAIAGRRLFFKCENLQRGGAFKIRGATSKMRSLTPEERRRGVAAFSSGNHAQAVAIAAGELGIDAKIVMPIDAPRAKVEATRAYGATIVTYDRLREDREELGRRLAEEEGRVLVPPYDD